MKQFLFALLVTATPLACAQEAQEAQGAQEETPITTEELLTALQAQSGNVALPGDIATLALGDKFFYLDPENTETLLVQGWGNPPGNETLGMVLPAGVNPLEAEGWGVVITYLEDGYVSDSDADEIDYNELLTDMKDASAEESEQRVAAGYGSMLLKGWAEPPRYDRITHKFYWAQEFVTDNTAENSLNYNIRVLGRRGVLVLNAVAGMNQIGVVRKSMPDLLAVTDFTAGNRYEDFDASTDHVAEYGLAALVAGGVAAKMGLFAKLAAVLIAFKKLIFVAGAAVVAGISKFFKKAPPQA
jgi:uncharacterized membrane-anchored protein